MIRGFLNDIAPKGRITTAQLMGGIAAGCGVLAGQTEGAVKIGASVCAVAFGAMVAKGALNATSPHDAEVAATSPPNENTPPAAA